MNLNQSSQSLSEFSLVSSSIPFQDYDFSDELESWDTSTYINDELGLLQLSQRTRSNSISSTHSSLSSGSSTETVPKSTVQYTNFGSSPFKTPPKLWKIQDVHTWRSWSS